MQNIHAELLTELAHSRIDEQVRAASRASATRAVPGRRGRRATGSRSRHRFPLTSA